MYEYNSETNTRVKVEVGAFWRAIWSYLNFLFNIIMLGLVCVGMGLFDYFTYNNILPSISDLDPPQIITSFLNWETVVYSIYIEAIGFIWEQSVVFFINKRNYRFKLDYFNSL